MCPTYMQRLSNGQKTNLLPSGECGHVSTRNYKRPGWAYVIFTEGRPQDVMAVKLDGSNVVERRRRQSYYAPANGASLDGTACFTRLEATAAVNRMWWKCLILIGDLLKGNRV